MKNLIVGNGINIQFGGSENTNKSIIIRAIKSCSEPDFPKHIIVDDPDLILTMMGNLFLEVQEMLQDGYQKYAISSDEIKGLEDLKKRYIKYPNLKLTDIGFEDYYLIYDLLCHKHKIINPDKYHVREAIKRFFLYSIYNNGKVNQIHTNFPSSLNNYFESFDIIFTTNYDRNIETFCGKQIFYLHGAFHIKADVYNPESMRNKLSDRPIDDCEIDDDYYYLYSNALTSYSGYSKKFSITQGDHANSGIEKMAKGYMENEFIRKDVDSWKDNDNIIIRNLYESIMLKIKCPSLKFDVSYPIKQFEEMSGEVEILGLSPFNDTHIFEGINDNPHIEHVIYYFYDFAEKEEVDKLLNNKDLTYVNVLKIWNKYK